MNTTENGPHSVRGALLTVNGGSNYLSDPHARSYDGWRAGKPVEDPEKMKRWGRISARPSEYLIHMRRGKLRPQSSGQGASCFKLPWDSVAIVPTTVQKLKFVADQVTSERVGVKVAGLAVYRIAEPLIAARMLNFSFPERAQEKLEQILVEMFVGAARRLVANLTVEECLARRKEGIAEELMREIAPVVGGQGRPEDDTDRGWGVVLDTIEIQDVTVLSDSVFAHMQAPYRQAQEQRAREAQLATERTVKLGEAEATRQIELTRLATDAEVRARRQQDDESAKLSALAAEARVTEARLAQDRASKQAELLNQREIALAKLEAELEMKQRRQAADEEATMAGLAAEARLAEARVANERQAELRRIEAEIEKARLEAEAQAARHAAKMAASQQEAEQWRAQAAVAEAKRQLAEVELAIAEIAIKKTQTAQDLEIARARAMREIENVVSQETIQLTVAQKLPDLAAAFQQNMGEVHVTTVDGANPFGYIASAIEGVMGIARAAGLSPTAAKNGES